MKVLVVAPLFSPSTKQCRAPRQCDSFLLPTPTVDCRELTIDTAFYIIIHSLPLLLSLPFLPCTSVQPMLPSNSFLAVRACTVRSTLPHLSLRCLYTQSAKSYTSRNSLPILTRKRYLSSSTKMSASFKVPVATNEPNVRAPLGKHIAQ